MNVGYVVTRRRYMAVMHIAVIIVKGLSKKFIEQNFVIDERLSPTRDGR